MLRPSSRNGRDDHPTPRECFIHAALICVCHCHCSSSSLSRRPLLPGLTQRPAGPHFAILDRPDPPPPAYAHDDTGEFPEMMQIVGEEVLVQYAQEGERPLAQVRRERVGVFRRDAVGERVGAAGFGRGSFAEGEGE